MKVAALLCMLVCVTPAIAQDLESPWTFDVRFNSTFDGAGQILKLDPTVGYVVNDHLFAYGGLPIYFVKPESTSFTGGVGNARLGLLFDVGGTEFRFMSDLVATAPTGNKEKGFSTGRATVDWTNTISRNFSLFTPFLSAGIANTVSDTSFFVRPFSSQGIVSHLEGGGTVAVTPLFNIGASGYGFFAKGAQTLYDRGLDSTPGRVRGSPLVVRQTANDHGIYSWLSFSPMSRLTLSAGYSRSFPYAFDSLSAGVTVHVK